MSNVRLVSVTPDAEKLMGYCARVSSPGNQDNPNYAKLLKYCIDHKHWSVFAMAEMNVEIETTRAISPQILRHNSFDFQEFSQRYAAATGYEAVVPRRQDSKNRQNSFDDLPEETVDWFRITLEALNKQSEEAYEKALSLGVAKECARYMLNMNVKTKLYMRGSVRSWIHYIQLRTEAGTQKEHRDIALAAKKIFIDQFPTVAEALGWTPTIEVTT